LIRALNYLPFPKIVTKTVSNLHGVGGQDGCCDQQATHRTGTNAFTTDQDGQVLADAGQWYLAGLLAHAISSCLLTTPTVTGYKRYQPASLAPFRATWGRQHRGAIHRDAL